MPKTKYEIHGSCLLFALRCVALAHTYTDRIERIILGSWVHDAILSRTKLSPTCVLVRGSIWETSYEH